MTHTTAYAEQFRTQRSHRQPLLRIRGTGSRHRHGVGRRHARRLHERHRTRALRHRVISCARRRLSEPGRHHQNRLRGSARHGRGRRRLALLPGGQPRAHRPRVHPHRTGEGRRSGAHPSGQLEKGHRHRLPYRGHDHAERPGHARHRMHAQSQIPCRTPLSGPMGQWETRLSDHVHGGWLDSGRRHDRPHVAQHGRLRARPAHPRFRLHRMPDPGHPPERAVLLLRRPVAGRRMAERVQTHGPQGLLHETRVRLRLVRQGGRSASPAGRDRTAFRSQARAYGRALLLLLNRAPRLAGIEFRQGGGEQDDPRMGVRHETRMARGPAPGLLGFRRRPDEKRHARHIGQQTPPARRQDARRRAWQPIRPEHARAQQGAMRHRGTDRAREDQLHARHIRSPAQEHHDRARLLGSCARNRGGTRKGARLQHHRRGRSQLHDRRDRRQELPIPVPGGPACGHA